MKKWILISITAIAVVALAGAYYRFVRPVDGEEAASIPRMMSVPAVRGSIARTLSATGRLEPVEDRTLQFRTGGTVQQILVKPGDYVEEGAELARLDQTSATLELLRSERDYEQALLDGIQSRVEEARLSLELTRASFEGTVLKAPFSGIVASVDVKEGSAVNAQTGVVRLVSRDAFKVVIEVDETELRSISVGQEVLVAVDSLPGVRLTGRVASIGWVPSSTSGSAVYPVEITIGAALQAMPAAARGQVAFGRLGPGAAPVGAPPADPQEAVAQDGTGVPFSMAAPGAAEGSGGPSGAAATGAAPVLTFAGPAAAAAASLPQLRPGLSVTIDIVIASASDVLTVPLAAVVESGGRSYVSRVLPDGSTEQVEVETGLSDGLNVAILSGLSEGDHVLMNNYQLYQVISQNSQGGNRQGGTVGQVRFPDAGAAVPIVAPVGGARLP